MTLPVEYREVNRPPVVGDLIKITQLRFSHDFEVGQICRITSIQSASVMAESLDGIDSWYVRQACFVVVEAIPFVRPEERPGDIIYLCSVCTEPHIVRPAIEKYLLLAEGFRCKKCRQYTPFSAGFKDYIARGGDAA